MSVKDEPVATGSVSQVLRPIRGRLIIAAVLAAIGTMLTLVPLAGIAHIAQLAMGQVEVATAWGQMQDQVWRVVIISLACLFLGMTLISMGEMVAHLADNHITGHLRRAITRRLARVPLGWFTSRASGEVKQAMQDDIGTLHSLTAHFFTTLGRTLGAIVISILYLFAMDWRMAIVSLLPFPLFFLFFSRATKASGANMQSFGAGMARVIER